MIAAHIFNLKKEAVFYVVCSTEALADLCAYIDQHHSDKNWTIVHFMKRIDFHNAFCFVKPLSTIHRYPVTLYKRKLEKENRWISVDAFSEAYCIADPVDGMQIMNLSLDQLIYIIRDNPWLEVFDVDGENIIEELQKNTASNPDTTDTK